MPDPSPVLAWGQTLLVFVAIGGTLVSFGILIARLEALVKAHETLSSEFNKHVTNVTLHPNGRDLSDRIAWLERHRSTGRDGEG